MTSDKECFDKAKSTYQDALNKSGYKYNLSYKQTIPDAPKTRRNRQRNIMWFNPPYSKNVETKVRKCFLSLIDHHFPKSNPLHKIFNRNTLKLSYSCMSNVKSIIFCHNKAQFGKPLNPPEEINDNCNCRNKNSCPLEGYCNVRNIVYQAEVVYIYDRYIYIFFFTHVHIML